LYDFIIVIIINSFYNNRISVLNQILFSDHANKEQMFFHSLENFTRELNILWRRIYVFAMRNKNFGIMLLMFKQYKKVNKKFFKMAKYYYELKKIIFEHKCLYIQKLFEPFIELEFRQNKILLYFFESQRFIIKASNKKIQGCQIEINENLSKYKLQNKINKLAKLYKGKKIAIYGAGVISNEVFEKYDLSKLNIVAVADIKFKDAENREFFGYNCIPSEELANIDCDVILIANLKYNYFLNILDTEILPKSKNEKVTIRPLIKFSFRDLFI